MHLFSQPISILTQTTLESKIAIKSESSIEMIQKQSSKTFSEFELFSLYLHFDSLYFNKKSCYSKATIKIALNHEEFLNPVQRQFV